MSCLVEALEGIVAEDRRTSELIQVRKTQAQTELQRDQALAQSRQSELKLRKLVGDLNVTGDGFYLAIVCGARNGEINRQIEFGLVMPSNCGPRLTQRMLMPRRLPQGQRPQLVECGQDRGKAGRNAGVVLAGQGHAGYSLFNGFSDDAAAKRLCGGLRRLVRN